MKPLESSVQLQWESDINYDKICFNFNIFTIHCDNCEEQQSYYKSVSHNYDNNIVNTSITGLLPNTTYTCCVLEVTSYGEIKPVCQNIITVNDESEFMI